MPVLRTIPGSYTSLMTTELNGLANAAAAVSATFDNTLTTNRWPYGFFELNVTFAVSPTAGNLMNLYIVTAPDGTNFTDYTTGAGGTAPSTSYVGGFPVRNVGTAQKIALSGGLSQNFITLPPLKLRFFIINNSGQALTASGHTLYFVPFAIEAASS